MPVWSILTILAAALLGALGAIALTGNLRARWRVVAALALGGLCAGAMGAPARAKAPDHELEEMLPARIEAKDYASSQACASCHPEQHQSWSAAWHRRMTQAASDEAIVAPFDGRILRKGEIVWRVLKEDGKYWAEELDPRELKVLERARIFMTTGSHQLQAYWIEGDDESLEQMPFVYLVREGRWLANDDSFLHPDPGDGEMSILPHWSDGCVTCHTTGPHRFEAPQGQNQDERPVVELGIGCESCHGPAYEHARTSRDPARRYAQHLELSASKDVINPAKLEHERASAVCGRCHSQTTQERARDPGQLVSFKPGDRYEDFFDIKGLEALYDVAAEAYGKRELSQAERDALGSMWPDHAVRIAGREYNGTASSACSTRGQMSCMSCHSLHATPADKHLKPEHEGQAACISCHAEIKAQGSAHTHHAPEGVGSDCLNCHMPYASYGLLKATRIHFIDSPNASGQGARDRPNACNLCHLDKTLAWTADKLSSWYGQPTPTLSEDHTGTAAGALWMLRGDAVQRAVAAWHISWPPSMQATGGAMNLAPMAATLLEDPYAAVRHQAGRALEELEPFKEMKLVSAPPKERAGLKAEVLKRWEHQSPSPSPALLVPQRGTLDHKRVEALKAQRDTLPIAVAE